MKPVICAAIQSEFGPKNEFDIPVLYTGIGKVNATFTLTRYLVENVGRIDTVVNVGSAGGILPQDKYNVIECGLFGDGDLDYPGHEKITICNWRSAYSILTFDKFQIERPDQFCHLVDMESYALAKVCRELNVKFYSFKYVSDIVGQEGQEQEWTEEHYQGEYKLWETLNGFFYKQI